MGLQNSPTLKRITNIITTYQQHQQNVEKAKRKNFKIEKFQSYTSLYQISITNRKLLMGWGGGYQFSLLHMYFLASVLSKTDQLHKAKEAKQLLVCDGDGSKGGTESQITCLDVRSGQRLNRQPQSDPTKALKLAMRQRHLLI